MLFVIVGVMWLSFKPVLAHASCVSSTLLASVKSVQKWCYFWATLYCASPGILRIPYLYSAFRNSTL